MNFRIKNTKRLEKSYYKIFSKRLTKEPSKTTLDFSPFIFPLP